MTVNEALERLAAHKAQGNGQCELIVVGDNGEWLTLRQTEFDTMQHSAIKTEHVYMYATIREMAK